MRGGTQLHPGGSLLGWVPLGGSTRQQLDSSLQSVQNPAWALSDCEALGKLPSLHLNFRECKMFPECRIFMRIKGKNSFVA